MIYLDRWIEAGCDDAGAGGADGFAVLTCAECGADGVTGVTVKVNIFIVFFCYICL